MKTTTDYKVLYSAWIFDGLHYTYIQLHTKIHGCLLTSEMVDPSSLWVIAKVLKCPLYVKCLQQGFCPQLVNNSSCTVEDFNVINTLFLKLHFLNMLKTRFFSQRTWFLFILRIWGTFGTNLIICFICSCLGFSWLAV